MNQIRRSFQAVCNTRNLGFLVPGRSYGFQSDISLNVLYPNSNLKIFTPPGPETIPGKFNGFIPLKELQITYSCSGGPGGQHVNRVHTKVDVRFNVVSALWIPEDTKKRLLNEHKSKINKEGYFVVKSDLTRSQQMNLADALNKIRTLFWELEKIESKPTEETLEKLRRRHERSCRERLAIKRYRSEVKGNRQAPIADEW